MNKKITKADIERAALNNGWPYKRLNAVKIVESGGIGFATDTGYIIIQFEPSWFKRKSPYTPSGKWSQNGVERQSKEYEAFSDAFKKNPTAAMESTSIGMFQIMGFHYKRLGFNTVNEMWDFAKVSEANQLELFVRFINTDKDLKKAMLTGDAELFAYKYNGQAYKKYKYDTKLKEAGF